MKHILPSILVDVVLWPPVALSDTGAGDSSMVYRTRVIFPWQSRTELNIHLETHTNDI